MSEEVRADIDASIAFLREWNPEGPWILATNVPEKAGMTARTFYPRDEQALRAWLAERVETNNIYFHVNKTFGDMDKKAAKEDILRAEWLHVDIDRRPGEDLQEEIKRSLRVLQNPPKGIPLPTAIVFSGNGHQGFWRLDEPVVINGQKENVDQFERYTRQLMISFSGDKNCYNVDRIMRLPGTINNPNKKKLSEGKVRVGTRLVEFHPERVYPLRDFMAAPELQSGGQDAFVGAPEVRVSGNIPFLNDIHDLDRWGVPDRIKLLIMNGDLRHEEGRKENDDSRSAWLFDAVCGLVRAEVPDETIFSVIMDPSHGISAHILAQGNPRKAALRTIGNAKEDAIDPALRELNSRHAVIANIGGRCRVVEEVMDPALGRTRITKQSFEDFRNRYMHRKIKVGEDPKKGDITMQLGQWWLVNPHRRQFDTIVFAPNKEINSVYNLWRGFAVQARPGSCDRFLEHVRKNICQGNERYYSYLIGWMARAVQEPDSPGQTALVLRGRMGTGKSYFAKTFGSLWGRHFLQVSDPKHLVGSFNAHLRDCVVLFGDEAFYAGDKKHESILKTLVTEETIVIEGKGVDAEASPNFTHIILASNAQWVVPAGGDERRYFVLDVGSDQMQNSIYFREISQELDSGGREALLHFLMTYDLSEFDVRAVPKTAALQEQKLLSLAPEEEWWYTKLTDGRVLNEHDHWQEEVMKDSLLEDYVEYMRQVGVQRRATATALGKFLARVCPGVFPRSYQKLARISQMTDGGWERTTTKRAYFYEFPPLSDCRRSWDEIFGAGTEWPEEQPPLPLEGRDERGESPF